MNNTKKAILVVSFGTSYHETREKNIDKIEEDIAKAYPDHKIYRAWTSKMILKKLWERDQIKILSVVEAIEQLIKDGITDLFVQPTHIINGIENDIMKDEILGYKEHFTKVLFGDPLLTTEEDNEKVIKALADRYSDLKSDEALVFMGHGTTHYSNSVYAALDYAFKDFGYKNIFVGTVEAYPAVESVLKAVETFNPSKIHLAPLMVVAGDHARNDLAGDEEDSWKKIFEEKGFDVVCHLEGLGEYEEIRKIYLEHIKREIDLT